MPKITALPVLSLIFGTTLMPNIQVAASGASHVAIAAQIDSTSPSLLTNGNFDLTGSSWMAPWTLYVASSAAADVSQDGTGSVSAPYSAKIQVDRASSQAWDVSLDQSNLSLVAGTTYDLNFWAKSSAGQAIEAVVRQDVAPFSARATQSFALSTGWQQYALSFTAPASEGAIRVQFNVGQSIGTVWLDSVTFAARAQDPNALVTATPTSPAATATPSATSTSIPPSATATSTASPFVPTATTTPVPPTATVTSTASPISPTATSTAISPTATITNTESPISPTATVTLEPPTIPTGAMYMAMAAQAGSTNPSLLTNSYFDGTGSSWMAPWRLNVASPAVAGVSQDGATYVSPPYSAKIQVSRAVSSAAWNVSLSQGNLSLTAGTTYDLTFRAKSSAGQAIEATVRQDAAPFTARATQWFTLTSGWQQYVLTFTAPKSEGAIRIQFNVGRSTGTVWLDSVFFTARTQAPNATATPVRPTATAAATTISVPGGVQAYPKLGSLNAFWKSGQAGTFSRYGLIIAPLSAAPGVSALKSQSSASKAVFYFNTTSVDVSDFDGLSIYPGWWLTLAGTTLRSAINATTTTIPVANASIISAYLSSNPDVVVDGESMHVTAVSTSANTLTVQRGYHSSAASHGTGARLAAHADKWPGSWMLNVTSYCPTNPSTGQTWVQYAVQRVRADMAAAPWNGVFLDDANSTFKQLSNGHIDANRDNVADGGDGPSGTAWYAGEVNLFSQLHSTMPGALLVGNGGYYPGLSTGREMERFPVYDNGWATGFNNYLMMAGPGESAQYTLLNADTSNTGSQSLRDMRFNLGTTLMGDGYYIYDFGTEAHGQTWWYDEYDNGAGSSLTSQINSSQTSIYVAAGTGSRFKIGDVVRVPNSLYTTSQVGALDDEQMRVTGISGDTLFVQRGYNGSMAAWHPATTKVLTNAQIAGGQGWLGQPLDNGAPLPLVTPNQLRDGGFDVSGSGWLSPWSLGVSGPAAAGIAQDTSTTAGGFASSRVSVTKAAPTAGWDVALAQQGFALLGGSTYTLTFYAKSSTGQTISVAVQQTVSPWSSLGSQYYTLTGNWQRYTLTFKAPTSTSAVKVAFNLGAATGTVWLDSTSLQLGDSNLWRRDFTHGTVLLNATNTTQTVTVGAGYRRIRGTQDPTTDNGAAASVVTIPAQDALLLDKTS